MSGKTYPVYLDDERQLRFDNTALRLLDRELTKLYDSSFASYVQRMGEEMGPSFYEDMDLGALNFDVMGVALKYGLRHEMPGVQDQQIDRMLDAAKENQQADSLPDVWATVFEAWFEASPFGLEEVEEEGAAGKKPESENTSDPYADAERDTTPAT